MQHKLYIDGIRGIAVLAVIFFHANYNLFKGGFLGVDIFFVLSGFLIIASIGSHIDREKFSFLKYYKKRFLRIVPAAVATLLIVLAFGLLVLFPEELINLYKNIYYILTIKSNVLAAESIDYFGIGVEFKPLVHYWSLSIELQFYIFFPLFIYLFLKYKYEKILLFLLISTLFLSMTYATFNDTLSSNEKYFSTYMRLWEFALGSITFLVWKQYNNIINRDSIYIKYLPFIGIFLIGTSLILYDKTFDVPSITTFIPAFGVSLMLLFSNDHTGIGKLLAFYPLRKLGVISYSLYLIHQPIFVFYRIIRDRDFYFYESILLIILTFVLGYLLWRFVEKPFQDTKQKYVNYKILFIILIGISLIFLSHRDMNKKPSDYILKDNIKQYLSFRYDNNPRLKECRIDNKIIIPENACKYGDPSQFATIVLWGDSHMDQIAMPLSKELTKWNYTSVEFSVSGCPPITNVDIVDKNRMCYQNSKIILDYIVNNDIYTDVVLFAYWTNYALKNRITTKDGQFVSLKTLKKHFKHTIEALHKKGKRIHIIYPVPQMDVNPPFHKARLEKIFGNNNAIIKLSKEDYDKQSYKAITLLDTIPKEYNVHKIYISELLKEDDFYIANNKQTIFYRDDNHLSTQGGGSKVSEDISNSIRKFIADSVKGENDKITNQNGDY